MRLVYKLIIMAVFIGVPLVAGTVQFIGMTQEALELKIRERHMDLANNIAAESGDSFTDIEKYLSTFLYNYGVEKNDEKALKGFLAPLLNQFEEFRVMSVLGENGEALVTMASAGEVSPKEIDEITGKVPVGKVLNSKKVYYSDAFSLEGRKGLFMILALPFPDGKRVLSVEFSLDKLQKKLAAAKVARNGSIYLLDRSQRIIAWGGRRTFDALEDLSEKPFLKEVYSKNIAGVMVYKSEDGDEILGAYSPVKGGWRVIVEEPKAEAYFTALRMRNLAIITILCSILIAFVAGTVITRGIVNPMRKLVQGADEIGKGNLEFKVGIESRDEIGFLSKAFDRMGSSLDRREKAISRINETTKKITSIINRDMLAETAIESLTEVSEAEMNSLIFDTGSGKRVFVKVGGVFSEDESLLHSDLKDAAGRCMSAKKLVESESESHGPAAALPLMFEGNVMGALVVAKSIGAEGFSDTDLHVFGILSSSVAISLQNISLLEETVEKTRMEEELKTAELVQRTLFPKDIPQIPGFDIAGFIEAASETGGDWYGFVHEPENKRIAIIIGDVTGHGVPAAMVTAVTYSFFRTLEIFRANANRGVSSQAYTDRTTSRSIDFFDPLSPDFMLRCINEIILSSTRGRLFMTLFASVYYYDTRKLVYANAGHNPPLVFRKDGLPKKKQKPGDPPKQSGYLMAKGVRLGDEENATFKEHEFTIEPGDTVMWYTDGLIECENSEGEEFGDARLKKLFESIAESENAQLIKEEILGSATKFYESVPHKDDITFVIGKAVDVSEAARAADDAADAGVDTRTMKEKRVLVVNSDKEFRFRLERFLRGYEAKVSVFEDAESAIPAAESGDFDLCILPIGGELQQIALAATAKERKDDTEFIFVSSVPFDDIIPIFSEKDFSFRLVRSECETCIPVLQASVAKLFTSRQWGIAPYLAHGTNIHALRIRDTAERMNEAAPVFEFAENVGITGHMLSRLRLIVDELLMNAMFDAPVDEHGKHKYASLDRSTKIKLSDMEAPVLEYGSDGRYFGIGVSDCFGRLTEEIIVRYLEKCLFNREKQYDDKRGGAGLGLFQLYKAVNHMTFNVAPGRKTESICFIKLKTGVKFSKQEIESIAFFNRRD